MVSKSKTYLGPSKALFWILGSGILGAIGAGSYASGVWMLPLGNVTSVFTTYPVVTLILARIFLKEKLLLHQVLCIVLIGMGAILIAKPSFLFETTQGGSDMGYLICLFGSLAFGSMFFFAKKASYFKGVSLAMLFSFNLSGVLISILGAVYIPSQTFVVPNTLTEYTAIAFFTLSGLLIQLSYNYGSKHLNASLVAVISVTEGFWAFLWQIVLFQHQSDYTAYVGAAIVVVCVGIICVGKGKASPKACTDEPEDQPSQTNASLGSLTLVPSPFELEQTGYLGHMASTVIDVPLNNQGLVSPPMRNVLSTCTSNETTPLAQCVQSSTGYGTNSTNGSNGSNGTVHSNSKRGH